MEAGSGHDREHDRQEARPAGDPPADRSGDATGGGPAGDGPPQDTPRRSRRRWRALLIGGAIALGLLFLTAGAVVVVLLAAAGGSGGGSAVAPETFQEEYVSGEGSDKIAVVPVVGVIGSEATGGALGTPAATPETLRDQLTQAAGDESVRAVILEVNSPGGGVVASAEMHGTILDFKRESGKPVVVSMGDTAASGGYYIATPADSIVANPGTLTGSLGVIVSILNYEEAEEKLGIEQEAIKSGEFKDIGSPSDPLSPEEREIYQELVNENYEEFVRVIAEGRGLPEERVRELADGRIYSGRQARDLDLVDELGNLEAAARVSRELAGTERATVVRYTQDPSFAELLQARLAPREPEAIRTLEAAGLSLTPELQYLYRP